MVILHIEANRETSENLQELVEGPDFELYQSPGIPSALATIDVLESIDVLLVSPGYAASLDTLRSALPLDPSPRVAILYPSTTAASSAPPLRGTIALTIDDPARLHQFILGEQVNSPGSGPSSGLEFGDYQLRESIGLTDTTEIYRAYQKSIDRLVTLELVKPEYLEDSSVVREFRAMVRAKAALVHPHVIPVYDAVETDGMLYYTTEFVQGMPLPQLVESGQTLPEKNLVQLILAVAETMSYLHRERISHRPLQAGDLFLDQTRQPHINNLAIANGEMPDQTTEITAFTNAIRPLASRGRILHLLQRLASDSGSWDELLDATNQYQQELRNFSAYQRTETEGLVVEPIERKRRRRRFLITGLLAAAGLAVVILPRRAKIPKPKDFSQMLRIRPGEFRFQGEDVVNLGGFWIMEYEVTIAQYAEFLDDVEKNAGSAGMVAHPSQPVSKSNYRPDDWDAFYAAARQGKRYRGQRLDVNCPVFNVDWWDASAFARWRGQRLPTEQEWERAARGERELLYPWGNTQRISSANMKTNEDTSRPEGYGFWTPVDHFEGDTTAAGIKGLAGNVEEWTESLAQHPDYPDRQVPVVRGGSFATEPDYDLTRRRAAESFKETSLARGFRTVSDIDPS